MRLWLKSAPPAQICFIPLIFGGTNFDEGEGIAVDGSNKFM